MRIWLETTSRIDYEQKATKVNEESLIETLHFLRGLLFYSHE